MQVDYFYNKVSYGCLDISDIGNTFIEAFNDKGQKFYIWTQTIAGFTRILTQNNILENNDLNELISESSLDYKRIEYNVNKLKALIKTYLNNYKFKITQAQVLDIPYEEKVAKFYSYFDNYKKEE